MDSPFSTPPGVDAWSPGPGASSLRLLPSPVPLDCYQLRGVIGEGTAAIVYLGTDTTLRVPVAVREYMPQGLAGRDAKFRVVPLSPAQEMPFARGLQAFIDEARTLARCDHPSLLRIVRLLEANGTAYSVMPHYVGRRLTDVRRDAKAAYDEDQLRALLGDLLGALEAFHAFGSVHGGVSPDNVLLLQNGRPLLLRPRAQSRETSGEPIDTLRGYLNIRQEAEGASVASATGTWTDVRDVARVIRFLMARGWAGYSMSFLEALDAAESPSPERRPQSVGEFREWLKGPPLSQPAGEGARRHDSEAPAEDMYVRQSRGNTQAPLASEGLELPDRESGPAAETTRPAAGRAERTPATETVDPVIPPRARFDRDRRTRRTALKSALLLGVLAVPATAIWLLTQPPVAVQGWSKALAPPSLSPSRNAPNSVATAVPTLPEAASQAPSRALENGGAIAGTSLDAARNAAPVVGDLAADGAPITSPSNPAPATTASASSGSLPQPPDAAALSTPVAPEEPRSPMTAAPVLQAAPKHGSPREFCGPRTQFALYRCMQTQCRSPKWSQHAQCIRLRSTDEVE